MKILYVSDLDGTLLNNDSQLSDFTIDNLNNLLLKGINFTVATARGSSAIKKLEKIKINVPIIMINGALIYDMETKEFPKIEKVDIDIMIEILNASENTQQDSLIIFSLYDNVINEYFKISNNIEVQQMREKTHKNMIYVDSFYELLNQDIISLNFKDSKNKIIALYDKIKHIKNVELLVHKDIYSEDLWFLECFSKNANKYNAINYLREEYNFEKIIAFGDGKNDIPLAENSNEFYATGNADEDIKRRAKNVLESNNDDGVVKWLIDNYKEEGDYEKI